MAGTGGQGREEGCTAARTGPYHGTGATMYMASDSDPPLDEEESEEVQIVQRASSDLIQGVSPKNIGYRPDFNPPGFTYKRREKSAMKKKKSNMEET